jgi:drug/metabolite transporter (DMT)-like permease
VKKYTNVFILSIVWAAYYVAGGIANKAVNPLVTGVIVRFVTFVLLTSVMLFKGTLKQLFHVGNVLPKLICVGILGFLLDITAFIGLRYGSSATGTVLLKTDVIMVNFVSVLLYKTKLTKKDWIFTVTMLAGVLVILQVNPLDMQFKVTDLFFLLSAAFVTTNAFLIKHIQTRENVSVSNDVIAYYNNFITMIIFIITALVTGNMQSTGLSFDGSIWFVLILTGIGQFFIYFFYYKSLRALPVWIVKVVLLLVPVFSWILELIFLNKTLSISNLVGSTIVLGSAACLLNEQRDKERTKNIEIRDIRGEAI